MMSLSRSMLPFVGALAALMALAACGDDDSFIPGEGSVAKTKADLPDCIDAREGEVYPVEEDGAEFKCKNGEWYYERTTDNRNKKGGEYDPATGTLTDLRDNRTYRTVKIGDQIWMAENLNYRYYELDELSPCYEDKEENCDKYGRLYHANSATVVCPEGWHLPDSTEFRVLLDSAAKIQSPAINALKATEGWSDYNGESLNGTDDLGFSLLPGGYMGKDKEPIEMGVGTRLACNNFWGFMMSGESFFHMVLFRYSQMDIGFQSTQCYLYVRCVKD